MEIKIVREPITKAELNEMAKQQFGDMVKAVVDVEQGALKYQVQHFWETMLHGKYLHAVES